MQGPRAASVTPFLALACENKEMDGGGTKMFHWRAVITKTVEKRQVCRFVLFKTNTFCLKFYDYKEKKKGLESRE